MKTTVTLFLFGIVIMAVHAGSFKEQYKQIIDECNANEATRLELGELKKAQNGEAVNEDQLSIFILCAYQKFGLIDQQGKISSEKLNELTKHVVVHPENEEKIIKNCGTAPEGSSAKAAALYLFRCARKFDKINVSA